MKSRAYQTTPTPVLDLLPSLLTTKTNRPQLVTFIRAGWGNQASSVSRDDVRRVRNALAEEQATRAVVGNGK